MKLTEHFTLAEMTDSQTATRRGISNTPSAAIIVNLKRVAEFLEQVRALVGGPITVSSGYRSPDLNKAIGGAANSAHVLGLAADINAPGVTSKTLARLIQAAGLPFDQLIFEGTWVHVGLSASSPRRQVLTATFVGGRATYSIGIA